VALIVGVGIPLSFQPPDPNRLGSAFVISAVLWVLFGLVFMLIPVAIGVSILRYRLWDIDVIIRRTLVYTLLTVLLALVYFSSVTLIQGFLSAAGGRQSSLVTVISTLLIAALFTPLRRRLQDSIDYRFYRRKYDAEKALADFAAAARSETDLDALSGKLVVLAGETMQPEAVSIWLPADRGKKMGTKS
jgi:hypothetical protein